MNKLPHLSSNASLVMWEDGTKAFLSSALVSLHDFELKDPTLMKYFCFFHGSDSNTVKAFFIKLVIFVSSETSLLIPV